MWLCSSVCRIDVIATPARQVVLVGRDHADQRLVVGADVVAGARRQVGQPGRIVLHREQERDRAEDAAGEHDLVGGERLAGAAERRPGLDHVAAARARPDRGDLGLGPDLGALALGEVEVVPVERVLGADPAPGHARATVGAADPAGAGAAEVRVRDPDTGLAEEDPDLGRVVVLGAADVARDLGEDLVAAGLERVGLGAQHPLRGPVVRRQLGLPVGEVAPRRRPEEAVGRDRQGVGVDQRAAADPDAVQDRDVLEERHLEEAAQAGARHPHPAAHVPVALRKVLEPEPAALLEDEDPVALLGQPERRDRAAEARPDHDDVGVLHAPARLRRGCRAAGPGSGSPRAWPRTRRSGGRARS